MFCQLLRLDQQKKKCRLASDFTNLQVCEFVSLHFFWYTKIVLEALEIDRLLTFSGQIGVTAMMFIVQSTVVRKYMLLFHPMIWNISSDFSSHPNLSLETLQILVSK